MIGRLDSYLSIQEGIPTSVPILKNSIRRLGR